MNKLLSEGPLLNDKGNLVEAGYNTSLVKEYSRSSIKGLKWRIKEWDYYEIQTNDYAVALTVADNSYMSLVSVSYLNFNDRTYITKSKMDWFTFGKLNLPSSSNVGDVTYEKHGYSFKFLNDGFKRRLIVNYPNFKDNLNFECDIELTKTLDDSLVIATPFKKNKHFYYNQKINCLKGSGYFKIGSDEYSLDNSRGVLDWGRGTWTYKNTWYWSSISCVIGGKEVGFNLGYGFGDTSNASENILFYNGKSYKLNDVEFVIPKNKKKFDYLGEWKFKSKDDSINLTFKPLIDRKDITDVLLIASKQHQVFGKFYGTIDGGEAIVKFDGQIGFAERVFNKW